MRKKVTKSPKTILNIGCGTTRIPGSIGVDFVPLKGFVDVVQDLEHVPYKLKSNSADEIHLYHVIEHLTSPLKKLEELHRILKPGGILYLRAPHFSSLAGFTDVTHIRPFGYLSFDIFQKSHPQHYYTNVEFEIVHKEIKYFGLYPNTGVYAEYIHPNECFVLAKPFVLFINFLIRLSPIFFERFWCYWVGGAGEVVVTLKKVA